MSARRHPDWLAQLPQGETEARAGAIASSRWSRRVPAPGTSRSVFSPPRSGGIALWLVSRLGVPGERDPSGVKSDTAWTESCHGIPKTPGDPLVTSDCSNAGRAFPHPSSSQPEWGVEVSVGADLRARVPRLQRARLRNLSPCFCSSVPRASLRKSRPARPFLCSSV